MRLMSEYTPSPWSVVYLSLLRISKTPLCMGRDRECIFYRRRF